MTLTSKRRAQLKSLANELPAIIQVGKGGISDNLLTQIDDALTARELIKVRFLSNVGIEPEELADTLAKLSNSEVVQMVGQTVILYRGSPKGRSKGGIAKS